MKTADQVYRLRIFLFSFARLSKCWLSLKALVEILADRDSDFGDLDEESDFYEPNDPEESSKEKMSDENVEDSLIKCEREESKMAAGWWVYKAPVGKGLKTTTLVVSRTGDGGMGRKSPLFNSFLSSPHLCNTCCGN